MRDTERGREREAETQRETQAPRREPGVGLHPGTLGSRPELKADAQPLRQLDVPWLYSLMSRIEASQLCTVRW